MKYLLWLAQTNVFTLKMQRNAVIVYVETACRNEPLHLESQSLILTLLINEQDIEKLWRRYYVVASEIE